jgi:hypothetical protein
MSALLRTTEANYPRSALGLNVQAAHFRFSTDSRHIATSHRSATNRRLTRDEAQPRAGGDIGRGDA